ncbi:MAG: endo-1,4-beta-xylanase [Armatimonadota bacterium]
MGRFLCLPVIALLLTGASICFADGAGMSADQLLSTADSRIEKIRKADVTVKLVYPDGKPAAGVNVQIEQTRHAFLFGCNIFPLFDYKGEQHERYGREFSSLLNYATLPFYWGAYESKPGVKKTEDIKRIARWCKAHNIETKGHPLVWHLVYPEWAPSDPDETLPKLETRVKEIVHGFKGLINRWDVVNEATVSAGVDNGVGHWAKRDGAAKMVAESLKWANEANPDATLLYNDFNISPDFEKLVGDLVAADAPVDVIGIQSHMHGGEWTMEKAWEVSETYARFGKPLHFTELTVLSGDHGWEKPAPWPTTPEGEKRQAEYISKFYTLLFSHPSVEAITWWDFMDGGWQGAPAGLVRADLTPKPAYDALMSLVKGKWWTKTASVSGADGTYLTRGFLGSYRVTVTTPTGTKTKTFDLKRGNNVWTFNLAGSGK